MTKVTIFIEYKDCTEGTYTGMTKNSLTKRLANQAYKTITKILSNNKALLR